MLAAWVCLFSCFLRHMRMYALQTGESFFWCLGLLILIDTAHIVCSRVCVQCLSVCPGYRRLQQRAADWLLCVRRDAAPKERLHCSTAVSSKGEQCHVYSRRRRLNSRIRLGYSYWVGLGLCITVHGNGNYWVSPRNSCKEGEKTSAQNGNVNMTRMMGINMKWEFVAAAFLQ